MHVQYFDRRQVWVLQLGSKARNGDGGVKIEIHSLRRIDRTGEVLNWSRLWSNSGGTEGLLARRARLGLDSPFLQFAPKFQTFWVN
jgi:hypothetical protein